MPEGYPFKEIEPKWQRRWEKARLFNCDLNSPKPKYYCLMMFPYPSSALHVGHGRNYIIGDVVARYKLMQGFNVLAPMGWDAFGLPAENAAIKHNIHPQEWTLQNIKNMKRQLRDWGVCYDWDREVTACLPDYYKWTQWIFLQLYKRGLAYRKSALVNFCPSCQTVLANEQVIDGNCERCEAQVTQKELEQWFFKITDYAERLLADLKKLKEWPERVKTMQENWIGKSYGVEIDFPVVGADEPLRAFTTRVDTIFGATYMVLGAEHPRVAELLKAQPNRDELLQFVQKVKDESRIERAKLEVEKEGHFTGRFAINPMNGRQIPIWLADYVLMEYGTGAIMAVPAHDQRDYDFAQKYNLPVIEVIKGPNSDIHKAYEGEGRLVNSSQFNGVSNRDAMTLIADYMESKGIGRRAIHYRLRDWLISRQRYWGAPIPIIYCQRCGMVPVPEAALSVRLPYNAEFKPHGESPLRGVVEFLNTTCPKCKGNAQRETDTMDTFVDSSWYFLRYISPKDDAQPFDRDVVNRWLPVDQYIGGVEHAILHLLYSRFVTKVLFDLRYINFDEPFARLFTQGMIIKDGFKMSKSKGNVVSPDELIEKYGADTVRLYTLFIGPPEKDAEWSDRGVEGAWRFLNRVWRLLEYASAGSRPATRGLADSPTRRPADPQTRRLETATPLARKMHQTIKRVTEDMEGGFHFNTAISAIMELVNEIYHERPETRRPADPPTRRLADSQTRDPITDAIETVILLLSPFVPHIAEEMWQRLGATQSIFKTAWPKYAPSLLRQEKVEITVQVNGRVRSHVVVDVDAGEDALKEIILKDAKVKNWVADKPLQKFIVVPNRLVNIVVQ